MCKAVATASITYVVLEMIFLLIALPCSMIYLYRSEDRKNRIKKHSYYDYKRKISLFFYIFSVCEMFKAIMMSSKIYAILEIIFFIVALLVNITYIYKDKADDIEFRRDRIGRYYYCFYIFYVVLMIITIIVGSIFVIDSILIN